MTGQHIADLLHAITGIKEHAVNEAAKKWGDGHQALGDVNGTIEDTQKQLPDAFGEKSAITAAAQRALTVTHAKIHRRAKEMKDGHTALTDVLAAMVEAQKAGDPLRSVSDPGDPPPFTSTAAPGSDTYANDMADHQKAMHAYNAAATAYGDHDEKARQALVKLNNSYDEASAVFAKIHGDPVEDPTGSGGSGSGGGGGGTGPVGGPGPGPRPFHIPPGPGPVPPGPGPIGPGPGPIGPGPGPVPPGPGPGPGPGPLGPGPYDPIPEPVPGPGPAGPGPGPGGSFPLPQTAGLAGMGVLGGLGARGVLGGLRPVNVPGEAVNGLGASGRTGGSGVLGRKGGGTVPGQQVGRGGRGGAGAAGGGSGRGKRKGDRGGENEVYDVEDEWTEDDGQFPGVIQ